MDQSQTQPTRTDPTPNPNSGSSTNEPGSTSATAPASGTAPVVPDKYDLKAPEGAALDASVLDRATPIFRDLGLDNAAAQKLVDFYTKEMTAHADTARAAIVEMGNRWSAEFDADPKLGPYKEQIKLDVGRALDHLESTDPGLKSAFQSAMDQTMVGNHPAFIRTFWAFAKAIGPGTHVSGANPSPMGQSSTGTVAPKSAAAAMYPHLVSKAG